MNFAYYEIITSKVYQVQSQHHFHIKGIATDLNTGVLKIGQLTN